MGLFVKDKPPSLMSRNCGFREIQIFPKGYYSLITLGQSKNIFRTLAIFMPQIRKLPFLALIYKFTKYRNRIINSRG